MKQREFLVLSRGKWDADANKEDIEAAISRFYEWLERQVDAGRMKRGSRLTCEKTLVSRDGIVTDGPYGESKEVIGGYWFIIAGSLREAAELAAENPCAQFGLIYEIRELEPHRASAFDVTNETPSDRKS